MKRIVVLAAAALLFTTSCEKKTEAPAPTPPAKPAEPTATPTPFTPTPDGAISPIQIKFWQAANPKLDSLATVYADSLSVKNKAVHDKAAESYTAAREAACKQSGISGGLAEYMWISDNIANPVNKEKLNASNLSTM